MARRDSPAEEAPTAGVPARGWPNSATSDPVLSTPAPTASAAVSAPAPLASAPAPEAGAVVATLAPAPPDTAGPESPTGDPVAPTGTAERTDGAEPAEAERGRGAHRRDRRQRALDLLPPALLGQLDGRRMDRRAVAVNDHRIGKLEPEWGALRRLRSLIVLIVLTLLVAAVISAVLAVAVEAISVTLTHAVSKGGAG